jgi:hypothetical protein
VPTTPLVRPALEARTVAPNPGYVAVSGIAFILVIPLQPTVGPRVNILKWLDRDDDDGFQFMDMLMSSALRSKAD